MRGNFLILSLLLIIAGSSSIAQIRTAATLPPDYLKLPIIRQATSYSCGAAAMLSILTYWGLSDENEFDLHARLKTNSNDGTHPKRMAELGKAYGLEVNFKENAKIEELAAGLATGETIILDFQAWRSDKNTPWKNLWEDGHYGVLIGMDSENIYLMDPSQASGYTFIPKLEFLDRWHDYETEKGQRRPYLNLSISFKGKAPLKKYPEEIKYLE